jgi:nucleoside-diphosphate-sugar epimerase
MRIFVTGASGFVGSAVVQELLGAGHQVLGLVRTEEAAARLIATGAKAQIGTLEDHDGLKRGANSADAVIHTAFKHDFTTFTANCALDRDAIEAIGSVLEGTDKPLLVTSGCAVIPSGPLRLESDPAVPYSPSYPRVSEATALALAARGVKASVVRLPPSVHGDGDHAFVPLMINIAREKGVAAQVGEGLNRWPAVHRLDAARVFRLAIERGAEGGPFHAVDEQGIPFKEITATIGRRLGVPVVSKTPEEAAEHFGWFAPFAGIDAAVSTERTRQLLGWKPEQPGLLADLENGTYFG